MARIKPRLKAAWVLLFFCLLAGAGTPAVWAGDDSGVQVVLTLDLAKSPVQVRGADPWSQTAGLLVHLLPEQDYLGLTATGAELPAAQLGTEERREILKTLAALKPAAQPQPFAEIIAQSLKLFQPAGPKTRVLFILSDGAGTADSQKTTAQLEEIRKIAAQARQAKIRIFAVCRTPGSSPDKLKILTSETGGCLWEAKTSTDLYAAVLNFYGGLGQHQEAPLTGTDFRLDPWVKKAMVVALHAIPGKSVVLTMPGGARITPRTQTRNASWVAGQAYDLITIFAPRPGIWSLSGAQPADSRVFLETNLTLTATGIPRVAGADEALLVTAALSGPEKTLAGAHGLGGTEILAELQMNHNPPTTIKLMAPESGGSSTYPPGARVGSFPPQHREGEATLRVTALGKTFQRSVELPITITQPWYRVVLPTGAATKFPPISFQPDQERLPQQLEGTVTLQSALGSLAGVLINPLPGSTIIMARPAGCQDSCLADLQLTGTGPGGRPLAIASGPRPLTNSPTATAPEKPVELAAKPTAEVNTQTPKTAPVTRKSKRRWLWLALVGVGLAFFGVAGWLFWEEGREGYDSEDEEAPEDGSGKSVLRLQAQVEALLKEKAQLQAALEEKDRQAEQFQAEKAELQAELERAQSRSQGSSKTLEQLEKRLEEAEKEAKGFQQEYMALYARSQEEKDTIKKN